MTISAKAAAFADFMRNASLRRRLGIAFAAGALMAFALPPFDAFPLLWLCFPILVILLQGASSYKQAFATGWMFAFGHMVFGLYWIAASMFVDLRHFWWAVPLSVAGLPACFAVYYGLGAMLARRIGLAGLKGAIAVGLTWYLADYTRGHAFSGFPWNLTGYAWSGVLPVLQITSLIGIYGLSLITNVAACLPAAIKTARNANIAGLLLMALIAAGGEVRLLTTHIADVPGVRLRLVQPNTDQADKWKPGQRAANLQQLLDLTAAPADKPVTHIIWPETASAYYLAEESAVRHQISLHIPLSGALITGTIRRDLGPEGETRFYNSLIAIDDMGNVVAGYDKFHLVPFGEYMPYRRFLPPTVQAVAAAGADFTPGTGARTLRVLGLPTFSPLICYEAIFPRVIVDNLDRPEMLLNVTNDDWYNHTTGPFQHFAIARVRAIEEGLPMARADNTGISAVIDPLGRIKASLAYGKTGFIDSDLPQALPLTLYARLGDIQAWVVLLFLVISIGYLHTRRKTVSDK